jgi:hypothetical protein
MTGFLQRLVDAAADVPPLAMPVPRSSSPIFSHDQRLGVRGLEMFGGLDHDPFEPVFEAPAMQAPRQPERTSAPPLRPPAPAADRAPPPEPQRSEPEPPPVESLVRPQTVPSSEPPAPTVAPGPAPDPVPPVVQQAAAIAPPDPRPMIDNVPEPPPPRPTAVQAQPAFRELPLPPVTGPRLVHPPPEPPSDTGDVLAMSFDRPRRSMLLDVARARDAEPAPLAPAHELRPVAPPASEPAAPPALSPPRSELPRETIRIIERILPEVREPAKTETTEPAAKPPLTASAASVIGPLGATRRRNRILALRHG